MSLTRKDSIKVADVLIPKHLARASGSYGDQRLSFVSHQLSRDERRNTISVRNSRGVSVVFDEPPTPRSIRFRKQSVQLKTHTGASARSSAIIDDTQAENAESTGCHTPTVADSGENYGWNGTEPETKLAKITSNSEEDDEAQYVIDLERTHTVKSAAPAVRSNRHSLADWARRGTIAELYKTAVVRGTQLERQRWVQILFEYTIYTIIICAIYFGLIGLPLWNGAVYWLYIAVETKFVVTWGWSVTIGVAFLYAFVPLLVLFESTPPSVVQPCDDNPAHDTALLIPCYKSETIIGPTLEAALKIFPASQIFVIANGNSETPLDNTEEICQRYGVCHVWCSIGSKIVAQYVGCHKAKQFQNVLLIDDDCALPPNFPIVTERFEGKVKSVGYTIKSVGPGSSKGTWCQQAQDLEYKLSGLQRTFAGKIGSATFPHGAISLWDRKFLLKTFDDHPGYSVSEDWFFGDSCRRLGGRIVMCSSVFVETETPTAVFVGSGSRGGFGEMTIFKQRFKRWNFFFVNGMYYNMKYLIRSWSLGWWELGAKLFVFQEIYETLLYLFTPFILPISFIIRPSFCGILLAATFVMYLINVIIFNEIHLRLKKERISWTVLLLYYMPYKIVLSFINVASCYWSLFKYAKYFAKRHPKIIEDARAVEVAMRVDDQARARQKSEAIVPSSSSSNSSMSLKELSTVQGKPRTRPAPISISAANSKRISFAPETPLSPKRSYPSYWKSPTSETHDTDAVKHD